MGKSKGINSHPWFKLGKAPAKKDKRNLKLATLLKAWPTHSVSASTRHAPLDRNSETGLTAKAASYLPSTVGSQDNRSYLRDSTR